MKTFSFRPALAAAACACAALPATLFAAPQNLNNCQTISQPGSYVVNRNLAAAGDCLVVAADSVTIDLDGFTITGNGTGSGIVESPALATRRNVSVRNGTVTGFVNGVFFEHGESVTVERVNASGNSGSGISAGNYATVRANHASFNGDAGIRADKGANVSGNTVARNAGSGIIVFEGGNVSANSVRANTGRGIVVDCPGLVFANTMSNNTAGNYLDISGGCVVNEHNSTL
jgi:hypothetical protein